MNWGAKMWWVWMNSSAWLSRRALITEAYTYTVTLLVLRQGVLYCTGYTCMICCDTVVVMGHSMRVQYKTPTRQPSQ